MTERPPEYLGNGRDTDYPGHRRAKARLAYARLRKTLSADHPAVRAALGRMLVYGGDGLRASVPQRASVSIEAIAWHRESRAQPGYWNRGARRERPTPIDDIAEIYFDADPEGL